MPKTKKSLPSKPCTTSTHHRENIDKPGAALCGSELGRCHYLISGELDGSRLRAIDCPECLRRMNVELLQLYRMSVEHTVKEGESKAAALNRADQAALSVEFVQMARLGLAVELRAARASLAAAMEDIHALTSRSRAMGEVRAKHDPVYRIVRNELLIKGTINAEDRARLLYECAPGDRDRMKALLIEDEVGEACAALSRRLSREDRLRQVAIPEPKLARRVDAKGNPQ